MSEMRERCIEAAARAIYAADHSDVVEPVPVDEAMRMPDVAWLYGGMATAAFDAILKEMEEPGKLAMEAGISAAEDVEDYTQDTNGGYRVDTPSQYPAPIWSAMLSTMKGKDA